MFLIAFLAVGLVVIVAMLVWAARQEPVNGLGAKTYQMHDFKPAPAKILQD